MDGTHSFAKDANEWGTLTNEESRFAASAYQNYRGIVSQACAVHKFLHILEETLRRKVRGLHVGEKPLGTVFFSRVEFGFGDAVRIECDSRVRVQLDLCFGEL